MKAMLALALLPLLGLSIQEGEALSPLPAAAFRDVFLPALPAGEDPPANPDPGLPPHDLHVSYGNLGVEGSVAILQLRIFKNDLEEALGRISGNDGLLLEVSPAMDALFLEYLKEHFILEVQGEVLSPVIVGSGYDELDREPIWTYQVRYDAPASIQDARITNTILFEIFDDQRNVVRVVKFPDRHRSAYYFAPGEATQEVKFGG